MDPKSAAIYCRVSSARQAEEGLSLPEQEKRCRAFAERQGWSVDESHVYIERGVSGGKASRPQLDRMMRAAEAGEFDVLVAPAVDRIGRSGIATQTLFARLDAAGVGIFKDSGADYSGDTKEGRLVRDMLASVAEFERASISERVAAVTQPKRDRGSYHGGPRPYGFDFGEHDLVIREDEAEVVRRIFREFIAGASLRGIANGLNEDGIRGPLGGAWSQGRVAEKLDMGLYAGLVGGGAQGRHEAIVDEQTWRRVRERREAQHESTPRGGRSANAHLLGQGLLRCTCGASMYPRKDSRSGRDTYRCRGRDDHTTVCNVPPLPRDAVDGAVRAYLARDVLDPKRVSSDLGEEVKRAAQEAKRAAAAADREAEKAESRIETLRLAWLDGQLPRSEFEETRAQLERDLTAARGRAAEARRVAEEIRKPSAGLLEAVEAIRKTAADEAASAEGVEAQRAALGRIFERFEILAVPPLEESNAVPPEVVAAQEIAATDRLAEHAPLVDLTGREIVASGSPAERERALAEALREQRAAFEQEPGPGSFDVHPRGGPALRVALFPIPRDEVVARFGLDPVDSLRELHPNSRDGLPIR